MNALTGSNHTGLSVPDKDSPSGLGLTQLENMLSDIRFQPIWRPEAQECDDYYDGHQLTQERLARMERLGIPPLVTNLIAPAVNAVLGMEAKTRTDWRVTQENEVQEVPEEMLDAMNAKLNEAERESRADRGISEAYAAQIKSGLGWCEVSRSSDALAYPYRVNPVHRDEIWWDWRARLGDLSDARYLIRKRSFDQDVLIEMMPEHKDLITFAVEDRFKTWQWDTKSTVDTLLAQAANIERISNIDAFEWRNADRRRAMLFEVWYRQWIRGEVLRLPTGRAIPFDKKDERHVAVVQSGRIIPEVSTYSKVRVAFYLGPHRLYDRPSPFSHRFFPYVPFFGYRESTSGVPYGVVRAMRSPQDVVNSADSKMHWMLNSRRLRASSDAIDTKFNSWGMVRESLARADSIILLDPAKPNAKWNEDNDNGLTNEQFQRRQQSAQDITGASGINPSMQGRTSNAVSGLAKSHDIEQGNMVLSEINDNYSFARRHVGELLFSMVREDLLHNELPVAVKKGNKKKIVVLNQRTPDGNIQNEVAAVPSKVVLEDVPSTTAFRSQQLQMLTQYTQGLPEQFQAALIDVVIGLTDIPQKDKVIDRLRKVAGIPEDMTPEQEAEQKQQQSQEEAIVKQLAFEKATAETDLLKAKVAELESKINKGDAEKVAKMVEAMYAALQAGQIVAQMPGAAPVADEILRGAGYQEQPNGQDPNIPVGDGQGGMPPPPPTNMQPDSGMPPQAVPDSAQPAQEAGMMQGIETPQADGVPAA